MRTIKKSGSKATTKTKIVFPKTKTTVLEQATREVTNSLQGTINSSYSQTNLYQENERLKQQIDEIKTNQLSSQNSTSGASVDLSPLESAISQNASDIDSLQTNVSTNANNISTLQQNVTTNTISIANNSNAITNLQNSKQDKLTAGSNIAIDSNNVISATNTTYTAGNNISIENNTISATVPQIDTSTLQKKLTAGQNITISDQNVISAQNTTYTAGTNVTIDQNNVISATCTTAGEQDLQEINQQLAELKKQVGILNGTYDENRLSGEFVPYADGEIVQTYDCYERGLAITKTGTAEILPPNVLFTTDTQVYVTENGQTITQTATANIDVTLKFIPTNCAGTLNIVAYDGSTQLGSFTQTFANDDLNDEQTFCQTISNIACTSPSHNFYLVCTADNSNTITTITYQKVEITAPNVVVINKVEPFDVQFNFYTNTYYLTNCTNGTLKICEISANDLSKTTDIVWTDTGIEAQNCKIGLFLQKVNGGYVFVDKYYLLTKKDTKVIVTRDNLTYNFVEQIKYASLFEARADNCAYFSANMRGKESLMFVYTSVTKNMAINGISSPLGYSDNLIIESPKNYLNYFSQSARLYSVISINQNDQLTITSTNGRYSLSSSIKHCNLPKFYVSEINNSTSASYKATFKYFDKFVMCDIHNPNTSTVTISNFSVLGSYDNFFLGANNDYFCVVDGKLFYYKF